MRIFIMTRIMFGTALAMVLACADVPSVLAAAPPQLAKELTLDLGGKVTLQLVQLPPGTFLMGNQDTAHGEASTQPASPILEFRIVYTLEAASADDKADGKRMLERLREQGPTTQPADRLRWYEVTDPERLGRPTEKWQDKQWLLCCVTSGQSMVYGDPSSPWSLKKVYGDKDPITGDPVIGFEFDPRGSQLFSQLTAGHIRQPLAIIVEGKLMSAPIVMTRIEGRGVITGKWTREEMDRVIRVLRRAVE